jgi:hypothetical protein
MIGLLTCLLLLTGCGASKFPNASEQSSQSSETPTSLPAQSVDVGSLARCVAMNHDVIGSQELNGFITAYASGYTIDRSKLRFIFTKVPAGVLDGSQFINAFGLYVNSSNQLQSTSAMGFAFISRFDGRLYNATNPVKALTKATIQEQFINANNLQSKFSIANFFNKAILVMVNVSQETQGVKFQVYNSGNSQSVSSPLLQIVPSKYLSANPYRYLINTKNASLANLHPYIKEMLDLNDSQALQEDATYYTKSEEVCKRAL